MPSSISSSPVQVRCKGILFDMDGILISSLESVERSWTNWALMRGVDPALACETAHGCRAVDTMAKLRPDLNAAEEVKIIEDHEMVDHADVKALPGVLELLSALNRNPATKSRWTVVTSATERLALVRLAAGGIPLPERIVAAEQVTQGKPHPDPFLAGAKLLGFEPGECVVFEDSSAGAQAGRAAGCIVVATTFSHPIDTLGPAHYLVTDLTGIDVKALPEGEGLVLQFIPLPG
jgi:sugar-phosphatase